MFNTSTSLHLSPGTKMAYRASTCAFHRFRSCAAVRTSLQDCHPALDLSFSTVCRQVVIGRPLFLLPSGVHVRAVTQSLSGCCLRICPMNCHLLLLTSSLNLSTLALSSSSPLASLIAFAAWAVFPSAYKVLTFQFPILNCVFGCTILASLAPEFIRGFRSGASCCVPLGPQDSVDCL